LSLFFPFPRRGFLGAVVVVVPDVVVVVLSGAESPFPNDGLDGCVTVGVVTVVVVAGIVVVVVVVAGGV